MLRHPRLILAVVAAVLMAPSLVVGTTVSHSSPFSLLWAKQFALANREEVIDRVIRCLAFWMSETKVNLVPSLSWRKSIVITISLQKNSTRGSRSG